MIVGGRVLKWSRFQLPVCSRILLPTGRGSKSLVHVFSRLFLPCMASILGAFFLDASPEPSQTSSFSSSPVTSSSPSSIHNLDVIQIMGQSSSSSSSAAASSSPSQFLGYFIMSTDCNHVSFAIIVQPSPYMMVGLNTMLDFFHWLWMPWLSHSIRSIVCHHTPLIL